MQLIELTDEAMQQIGEDLMKVIYKRLDGDLVQAECFCAAASRRFKELRKGKIRERKAEIAYLSRR